MHLARIHFALAVCISAFATLSSFAAQDNPAENPHEATAATNTPAVAAAEAASTEPQVLANIERLNEDFIALGKLGIEKGATTDVRRYGDRIVRDHTLSNLLVAEYSRDHTVPIEKVSNTAQTPQNLDELKNAGGEKFDSLFVSTAQTQYGHAIESVSKWHDQLRSDSALKLWLSKMLPILKQNQTVGSRLDSTGGKDAR